jgi:hypothetical protein
VEEGENVMRAAQVPPPAAVVELREEPEGRDSFTDETGKHHWEYTRLESAAQGVCTVHEGCNAPATHALLYVADGEKRPHQGCEKHTAEWIDMHIDRPKEALHRFAVRR